MIEDLTRHRQQALRTWAHPLSRPVRDLCDEVELLRRQLAALIADNDRLRANMRDLRLADNAARDHRDPLDQERSDERVDP